VPVLLVSVAHSAMLTPEARNRGSLMPHAEVATVPGSQGGFNRLAGQGISRAVGGFGAGIW